MALNGLDAALLPEEIAISVLTMAEMAAGPRAAKNDLERVRRRILLHHVEVNFEALDFDRRCASAYGHIYAAAVAVGRKIRGSRAIDGMIAATALAYGLPLYTFNAKDLRGLDGLIEIVDLGSQVGT